MPYLAVLFLMMNNVSQVSKEFRNAALWSVASILLFVLTYVLLVGLALALILACGYAGVMLVASSPSFATVAIGIVIMVMGLLVLVFLFKFIFKKNRTDRSHLIEVTAAEHPRLFELIGETVREVGTQFPKKVYFSTEVNAAVFYDSSFWSMFLPVKKNLQIGLALVNSMSVTELKAVLAHEFGHFSQRSMKVGSYVYNVNQVLYNMLYDNEGYHRMAESWAGLHSYVGFGVRLAMWIVGLMQSVLKKVYEVLNLNYYSLSREMEFHADAVAASVAGSAPMISALLRLNLSNHALDIVINHYNGKIDGFGKALNFYPGQRMVMNYFAGRYQLPLRAGLPQLGTEDIGKFDKSKLVLKDQWASHPSTVDRVNQLMVLGFPAVGEREEIASSLLNDPAELERQLTANSFREIDFHGKAVLLDPLLFEEEFLKNEQEYALPEVYRGYYDFRSPFLDLSGESFELSSTEMVEVRNVFDEQALEDLKVMDALHADLDVLRQIEAKQIQVKTFDYEGQRYKANECGPLIHLLESEIAAMDQKLTDKDREAFDYFNGIAAAMGKSADWKGNYLGYKTVHEEFERNQESYFKMAEAVAYMNQTLPFKEIRVKTEALKIIEPQFKDRVRFVLGDPVFSGQLNQEQTDTLTEYLSDDWKYFGNDVYVDKEVEVLFAALGVFYRVSIDAHYRSKQNLLVFQAALIVARS